MAEPLGANLTLSLWDSAVLAHPAGDTLSRLFAASQLDSLRLQSSGITASDYLEVVAGIVDFFRAHQDERGAIVDPYVLGERQYSTPAFAFAASLLVIQRGRSDLLQSATRALTRAVTDLAEHNAADGHPDFYIPLIMHARRLLAAQATDDTVEQWDALLRTIIPEETYRDATGHANWNIVNVAGECLRAHDGLVPEHLSGAHRAYIEASLAAQERLLTPYGLYEDGNAPLAYDAFPRLWMEDVLADGAYDGSHREEWERFLTIGGLSSLLMLSPSGEWPCGGRSAHHQWNEAQIAAIFEMNAVRWKHAGNLDVAGAFKRSARLAFESVKRWRRPAGELSIVKNWADPGERHGFEVYSYHSQYNLLAAAMLAVACLRADDSIAETPAAWERGSYIFELKEPFRKVIAVSNGVYAQIDTGCDPHYTSNGLVRVHTHNVARSGYSDNACADRRYGPPDIPASAAIAPGLTWGADTSPRFDEIRSLANSRCLSSTLTPPETFSEGSDSVPASSANSGGVTFQIEYVLEDDSCPGVVETYTIVAGGVEVTSGVTGCAGPDHPGVFFPLLLSDGANDTGLTINGGMAEIRLPESVTRWEVLEPEGARLRLCGPRIPCHNGWLMAAWSALPAGTSRVRWRVLTLPVDG